MNEVTITFNGTTETFQQDDIVSPTFECDGCYKPEEYLRKIAEIGLMTVTHNPDGSHTYRHVSPHCICNVEFTDICDLPPAP